MKKSESLTALLEDLKSEAISRDIVTSKTSEALIYLTEEDFDAENPIKFSAEECALVFSSPDTVERLLEALNYPIEATLCLVDLGLDHDIVDLLERKFVAVDEG
jgi:hypothetical protein